MAWERDEVVVVSPAPHYNWIPSNIWVGVGLMTAGAGHLPLAPVYSAHGIEFRQAAPWHCTPKGATPTRART